MSIARAIAAIAVLLAALSVPMLAVAQKEPKDAGPRAAQELDAVRGDPLALHVFLRRMPKGADLHNHLDGAVYAETGANASSAPVRTISTEARAPRIRLRASMRIVLPAPVSPVRSTVRSSAATFSNIQKAARM